MKRWILLSVILLLLLLPIGTFHRGETSVPGEDSPKAPGSLHRVKTDFRHERPTVLVHDVTPYYFEEIREIIGVLDEYNYSNSTILFVIPVFDTTHYGDEWDLRKHPDFIRYLNELRGRGYRIELHGYAHTYHEFNCSYELASGKLDKAISLMTSLGFKNLSLFLPPAWAINNESLRAILEHNLTVIMVDYMILPKGSRVRIVNREYTWYINESQVPDRLRVALHDYRMASRKGVPFYLSVHPGVVNYGGGLDFLRKFLEEVGTPGRS